MNRKKLIQDATIATAAGYVGTKAMEQIAMKTYQLEPEKARQREDEARPGPPPQLAADKLSRRVLGVELADDQLQKAGMAFHYLAGVSWTPTYVLLRRFAGWNPIAAGLATGASLSLIVDEIMTPAIGASAPNRAYPPSTHIRGFVAHLAYGLTVAAVVEVTWKLLGRRR